MKRPMITLIFIVSTILSLSATTAYASAPEMVAISGNFVIVNWQNTSITQNGPNTVITSVYSEVVTGNATGTVTGEQTAIVHPDGSQTVHGLDTCVCSVNGVSFTAVLSFQAVGDLSFLNGTWVVVNSDQDRVEGQGVFSVNLVTGEILYQGVVQIKSF